LGKVSNVVPFLPAVAVHVLRIATGSKPSNMLYLCMTSMDAADHSLPAAGIKTLYTEDQTKILVGQSKFV
jgi:hypothetical protein